MYQYKPNPLHLIWLFLTLPLVLYIIRPHVIQNHYPSFLVVILNSYPNFLEAICGFLSLLIVANWLCSIAPSRMGSMKQRTRCLIITIITSIYVFTRELKLHHLGGSNTYDRNDIIASVIGLIVINLVFIRNQRLNCT